MKRIFYVLVSSLFTHSFFEEDSKEGVSDEMIETAKMADSLSAQGYRVVPIVSEEWLAHFDGKDVKRVKSYIWGILRLLIEESVRIDDLVVILSRASSAEEISQDEVVLCKEGNK